MPKGNPSPKQTEEFKEKQFQAYGDLGGIPLAKKVTAVRLPVDVDETLRSLPDKERVAFLRRVISEAVRAELMSDGRPPSTPAEPAATLPVKTESDRPTTRRKSSGKSKTKTEFRSGQMVKNPAGWRGWITKLLDDGKAIVDWENQISGDVIPLHLLTAGE